MNYLKILIFLFITSVSFVVNASEKVKIISNGEIINLKSHLHSGKITIFDFYADWCRPCKYMDADLKVLLKKYPNAFVLKKIRLKGEPEESWKQPIVEKEMNESEGLPFLKIYSPEGKFIYQGGDIESVEYIIKKQFKLN